MDSHFRVHTFRVQMSMSRLVLDIQDQNDNKFTGLSRGCGFTRDQRSKLLRLTKFGKAGRGFLREVVSVRDFYFIET